MQQSIKLSDLVPVPAEHCPSCGRPWDQRPVPYDRRLSGLLDTVLLLLAVAQDLKAGLEEVAS